MRRRDQALVANQATLARYMATFFVVREDIEDTLQSRPITACQRYLGGGIRTELIKHGQTISVDGGAGLVTVQGREQP